jgi:hypothetical protein
VGLLEGEPVIQYGTHAFDGPPAFTLDFTRQFETSDSDGDHDHDVQVHCELGYGLAPDLEALGSFDSWFFHDAGDDLEEWAQGLTERAAWATIHRLKPAEIRPCPALPAQAGSRAEAQRSELVERERAVRPLVGRVLDSGELRVEVGVRGGPAAG